MHAEYVEICASHLNCSIFLNCLLAVYIGVLILLFINNNTLRQLYYLCSPPHICESACGRWLLGLQFYFGPLITDSLCTNPRPPLLSPDSYKCSKGQMVPISQLHCKILSLSASAIWEKFIDLALRCIITQNCTTVSMSSCWRYTTHHTDSCTIWGIEHCGS